MSSDIAVEFTNYNLLGKGSLEYSRLNDLDRYNKTQS